MKIFLIMFILFIGSGALAGNGSLEIIPDGALLASQIAGTALFRSGWFESGGDTYGIRDVDVKDCILIKTPKNGIRIRVTSNAKARWEDGTIGNPFLVSSFTLPGIETSGPLVVNIRGYDEDERNIKNDELVDTAKTNNELPRYIAYIPVTWKFKGDRGILSFTRHFWPQPSTWFAPYIYDDPLCKGYCSDTASHNLNRLTEMGFIYAEVTFDSGKKDFEHIASVSLSGRLEERHPDENGEFQKDFRFTCSNFNDAKITPSK
jgi:hypothetical protein